MSSPKPIGGYFELELPQGNEFHSSAIALNTGRNCLEYILRVRGYQCVYLPYYSCEVILEPFKKLNVDYKFYHINGRLEPDEDIGLCDGEAILYINYYGLKQDYTKLMAQRYGERLIADNTQAFFAPSLAGIDTFYSCRKFFGVSDGAYLFCDKELEMPIEQDRSWERMGYLLERIDISPESGYGAFLNQSKLLCGNPIKTMSRLTKRLMQSIDYGQVAERRRRNFEFLDAALHQKNGMSLPLDVDVVPMVYPFLSNDAHLRQRLIDNKIFVATYWPNVRDWCDEGSLEHELTCNLLPLPIDQRYDMDDMERFVRVINEFRQ